MELARVSRLKHQIVGCGRTFIAVWVTGYSCGLNHCSIIEDYLYYGRCGFSPKPVCAVGIVAIT
jgi:hypothetical protein